jgi:hypothetical protein
MSGMAELKYILLLTYACSISAIAHMAYAIYLPHGITYYENNMIVKIVEIFVSFISIFVLFDLIFHIWKR